MQHRHRACAAILQNNQILMVRHQDAERSYWTLPGGAIEPGETAQNAAVREVWEETGLRSHVVRFLFEEPYLDGNSLCLCFLLEIDSATTPRLGHDPEEQHKLPPERLLQAVAWITLESMRQDRQVSQVLAALSERAPFSG